MLAGRYKLDQLRNGHGPVGLEIVLGRVVEIGTIEMIVNTLVGHGTYVVSSTRPQGRIVDGRTVDNSAPPRGRAPS